ncbi:modular serine protease-like [Glossina fuscipes fuscipes]
MMSTSNTNIIYFGIWVILIQILRTEALPTDSDSSGNENKCQLPENYLNLVARLHPQNETIPFGSWVDNYEIVHLDCSNGDRLETKESLNCQNGDWIGTFPACDQYCDAEQLLGLSTFHKCINNDTTVLECQRVEMNSEVIIGCNIGYEGFGNDSPRMRCPSDGKFTDKRPTCNIDCGVPRPNTALTLGELAVEYSEMPWQVAIYQKTDKVNYKFVCGGSIVSPSVIVTAAHCFWDAVVEDKMHVGFFQVVAGKYYRDYDMTKDPAAQAADIAEIVISSSFRKDTDNFLGDVAVVKLKKPFIFNDNISAVCLNIKPIADLDVPNNQDGAVMGYNKEEENIFRRLPMKSLSHHTCQLKDRLASLANDKFCLQNEDEATLCRGDPGGGFVAYNSEIKRHELLGIISYTRFRNAECVREGILTATNVNYISDEVIQKLEQFKQEDKALF